MSTLIEVEIKSNTKPTNPNPAICDTGGNWYSCSAEVAKFVNKGDKIKFNYGTDAQGKFTVASDENGNEGRITVVERAKNNFSGGNKGGQGGKKGFTDNSVGMGVGAALNNAVALVVAGKINEGDIPLAMVNLYKTSEYAKKLASEGKIDQLAGITGKFSFTNPVKVAGEASQPAQAAPSATPTPAPAPTPAAPQAPSAPSPAQGPNGVDFDDDIPF